MDKGFTIIELIITLFILSIAVIGIFSAFSVMGILSQEASDRLAAAYLAQEGMEIIRNIRDSGWIGEDSIWDTNLTECETSSGCQVDYATDGLSSNPVQPFNESFLMSDSGGFYSYSAGQETKYKRQILINAATPNILKVTVRVFWKQKPSIVNLSGENGSIEIEETLYDWY